MLRLRSPHTLISCTVILCSLLSMGVSAQPRFDTQIANANGKVVTNINQNLIDILTSNGALFDRSRRYFDVGLNWDGLDNKHAKTILGVTIMDDFIDHKESGVNSVNNVNRLSNCPPNSRFIAVDQDDRSASNLLFDMGFSAATRVDFELDVDDVTDEPAMETGTNTGALHGFDTVGNGTVNGKHVELRRSQGPSVYADNSNQRIWSTTSAREHKRNNVSRIDPMRSGEMIVVGICLRRSGVVPDDGDPQVEEADFDVPVVSLRIRRQQRLTRNPLNSQLFVDGPSEQFLRFSFVPTCATRTDYTIGTHAPNQIGVDDLPHLFNDLSTPPTSATAIDSKFMDRAVYTSMPLMDAQSKALDVTGREFVWEHMKDVRHIGTTTNEIPDEHEEIVITKGMLRRLRDNAATPGNTSDPYDGTSNWTIFEGLLVFGAVDQAKVDQDLFVYDEAASPATHGFGSSLPNLRFVEGGRRGRADGNYSLGETDITNLRVEVVYYDEADVDVDYVVLQTPNGRALLRDQFRDSISASIGRTVHAFSASNTTVGGGHKLLGIRSAEEVGEIYWYAQRYLNILTNGAMLSEISMKPYNRYKHCVYPFTSSGGSYPANPLPLWTWNEGSTGRPDPLNPAPFLKNGGQSYSKYYAMGYKSGVCGGSWSNNGVHTETASGPCKIPSGPGAEFGVRLHAHDHDIGWPCDASTPGSKTGWFAHFKSAPEKFWADVKFFETENTDYISSPADPIDENEWPEAPENTGNCVTSADNRKQMSSHLDWPPTLLTSVSLHNNYIYRGNANFLFDGHSWLEQVWLGTDKDYVRGPTTNDPNDVMTVQVSSGDQARPLTGEEIRLKLMAPTLLGADGLMLFVGDYRLDIVSDPTTQRFQVLFNLNNYIDAKDPNATLASVEGRMRSPVYGKDYPTFNGSLKTLAAPHTITINNVTADVKSEGYVEDHYPGTVVNGVPTKEKLWISKYAYTNLNNIDIGGLDLVQRVLPSGIMITPTSKVEQVYIGSQSGRYELLRYTDWLKSPLQDFDQNGPDPLPENRTDNTSLNIRDEPQSVQELLALLDLQSWFSKGYKQHSVWREKSASAPDPMLSWLDPSRLRTRHPNRVYNARADYEDADSTFVDVTLHYRRPNLADEPYTPFAPDPLLGQYVKDEFYIGVQNRRQNPLYMVDDDQPKFSSTEEFFALVSRSTNNHGLYDQLGSRTVILPFEHEKSPTEPVLLHVTEVGDGEGTDGRDFVYYEHNDNGTVRQTKRRMIDTIIDGYGSLEVNLLPCEGRLLRVKVLPAVSTDQIVGNLAFNGQTKLVVAPEQIVDFSVVPPVVTHNDEKLVYHMVYTRMVDNVLRVFYRPSLAYHRDHVPEVAGLKWGSEVEIGESFVVQKSPPGVPGTIWQSDAHQFDDCYPEDLPVTVTHGVGNVIVRSGFPSICIARNVEIDALGVEHSEQRIHIVYSSLVFKNQIAEQHIVETTFRAGATPITAELASRSLAVIGTQNTTSFNDSFLTSWGTPTNGVSSGGVTLPPVVPRSQPDRVFTAWSVRRGIGITSAVHATWGAAFPADGGYFTGPVNGLYANVDQFDITQVSGEDRWTAYAQYPSLTPTNTAVGGTTPAASLVWQEQARRTVPEEDRFNGWAIMYTRVWEDDRQNPPYGKHDYGFSDRDTSMPYLDSAAPQPSIFASIGAQADGGVYHNYVMRVSQAEDGRVSLYPTIVRSGLAALEQPPMLIKIEEDPVDDQFFFQFESLTWQSVTPVDPLVRVQRRHFIHHDATALPGPGNGMRYWVVGSSHSTTANLIAPTISNGALRLDEQRYVNPTNDDEIAFIGNVSDTATFSAFGMVYGDLSSQGVGYQPAGNLNWETWAMPQTVWQVHLRYVPVPAIPNSYVPYGDGFNSNDRRSRSTGVWPHLSHQGLGLDQAKQNVRRVQHSSAASQFSSILVSAEGFYKEKSSSVWQMKAGYFDGEEEIAVGGWLDDGEEVEFRREHRYTSPLESMFFLAKGPAEDLVSQPFSVKSYREVKLDIGGMLRDDLTLTVEEVDETGRPILDRSANVGLPERPQKTAKTSRKEAQFTFVGGGSSSRYRFRLHPSKNMIINVEEVLNDASMLLPKEGDDVIQPVIVDLDRMEVARPSGQLSVKLVPNPADEMVTIIPVGTLVHTGPVHVDIYSSAGDKVDAADHPGNTPIDMDVAQLPAGVYTVVVTTVDGQCVLVRCVIL